MLELMLCYFQSSLKEKKNRFMILCHLSRSSWNTFVHLFSSCNFLCMRLCQIEISQQLKQSYYKPTKIIFKFVHLLT
ncbi:hypothetical protein MUK42_04095 [Musa troglodytarum]|uniref:Uncharacterized protein n=1 Tax=Musa troglodytarum TaxID=320322 RepID=A0A9E7GHX9_9LILI|nr:hypothetical protein MUK42_04095 [Musa troglodytarum]